MSVVLVDLDGVLADWGAGYGAMLDKLGSDTANIPRHEDQRSFNLTEGLTAYESELVQFAMDNMDYLGLAPIEGGAEALDEMSETHDVFICSSPWLTNAACVSDKMAWVDYHFGVQYADRTILTKDKTLVYGDVLIDDKPRITGVRYPIWQQVLFDQPYNQDSRLPRINAWSEWRIIEQRVSASWR